MNKKEIKELEFKKWLSDVKGFIPAFVLAFCDRSTIQSYRIEFSKYKKIHNEV